MTIDELKAELERITTTLNNGSKETAFLWHPIDIALNDLVALRQKVDSMSPERDLLLSFLGWVQVRPYPKCGEFSYYNHLDPRPDTDLEALVDKYLGENP